MLDEARCLQCGFYESNCACEPVLTGETRTFSSGATRDTDTNKLDFEGFLNPIVDESFAEFMHRHRIQSDGQLRDSDNWQKGIPRNEYMKSLWRHFQHLRLLHRGYTAHDEKGNVVTLEETLNAIRFNVQGYLLETLKERE